MRNIIAVAVLLLVGGCAMKQVKQGLDGLLGQDLNVAVSVLGFPTSERQVAGMRLVEWGRSSSATFLMPTTSTSTGYVQSGSRVATYSGATTSSMPMMVNYQCHIALQVDANNIIQRYQFEGNEGGCAPYGRALKQSMDAYANASPAQRRMQE